MHGTQCPATVKVAQLKRGRVSDPAQAALSGSHRKAPGSAGGYLLHPTEVILGHELVQSAAVCLRSFTAISTGSMYVYADPLRLPSMSLGRDAAEACRILD